MNFGRDIVQSRTTTGLGNDCRKTRVPNLSLGGTSYLDMEIVKRSIQIEERYLVREQELHKSLGLGKPSKLCVTRRRE